MMGATECLGERYVACGKSEGTYELSGTPGNALGAYLDGARVVLHGNAQDATGDTMNAGSIIIHGSTGDAAGYAMRGGEIYVRDNAGYRAGIHMKAYREHQPVLVVGGRCGSFLGEYQAGGVIVVLGIGCAGAPVGYFCGTGMHGGRIYLRTHEPPKGLPLQVKTHMATDGDRAQLAEYVERYCELFGGDAGELLASEFAVLEPDSANPYRQLYAAE